MCDLIEAAAIVRRREALPGAEFTPYAAETLAAQIIAVTPRTRHQPSPRKWPALTVIAVLLLIWTAVAVAILATSP